MREILEVAKSTHHGCLQGVLVTGWLAVLVLPAVGFASAKGALNATQAGISAGILVFMTLGAIIGGLSGAMTAIYAKDGVKPLTRKAAWKGMVGGLGGATAGWVIAGVMGAVAGVIMMTAGMIGGHPLNTESFITWGSQSVDWAAGVALVSCALGAGFGVWAAKTEHG